MDYYTCGTSSLSMFDMLSTTAKTRQHSLQQWLNEEGVMVIGSDMLKNLINDDKEITSAKAHFSWCETRSGFGADDSLSLKNCINSCVLSIIKTLLNGNTNERSLRKKKAKKAKLA
ncbi:hypothetical protein DAPPUDRAFT_326920 [Daphnia pulex]|uniref:Uncharacterized protein n=1 Tax=Daphnia pulex TaxID=6669 RepID=E9H965_DAPPU|nr:hypothetical protein DAPPUDRAFT_326920 [Daphnia pulex]|eukprot:EFX71740.1 hypothetical protein DAPPUDRAFT_326920 [Daphnia pulex]